MSSSELYVVTGVSGRTGAATARALLSAGKNVRVVVRTADKGYIWANQGAEVALADFTDLSALSNALSGATGAYILSPQQYAREDLFIQADIMACTIAEAITRVQLPKVVALSSIGADQTRDTGWIAMNRTLEQRLGQSELPVTFLRAAYFMENWSPLIKIAASQEELPSFLSPLDRKISMIATDDVGHIAADALCQSWNGTRIIELEGPNRYSPNDVAKHVSKVLGKTIGAAVIPESNWKQALSGLGFSFSALTGFIEMTRGLNSGHIAFADDSNIDHRKGTISFDNVMTAISAAL